LTIKPGDFVLIDCSHNPYFGSNAIRARVITAYDEGIYRYGCAYEWELPTSRISIWCRGEQLKKIEPIEVQA
jgi:hypothetical protein